MTGKEQDGVLGSGARFDVLRWIFGLLGAVLISYFTMQQAVDARIGKLEAATERIGTKQIENNEEILRAIQRLDNSLTRIQDRIK